ncbi:AMP-binding protein [Alteromonas gilva]|uniref:Long-chain-fatty-acid--CoA ligase n=1 Tax=Alteromonas gilva TaxID=2987522 RepID=A0ABT5KXF6_9ALTE|nr:AMP-binding protein [Alteromonas gilva]MDC8829458.1 AMP-binding protein [Alteromonas gilva]
MSNTFPLVTRQSNEHIAFLTQPIEELGLNRGVIETNQFVAHVYLLAENLPAGGYAINLCENRYLFMVGFCAAILRGDVNLLPPNKNIATQKQLSEDYQGCYIIHDGCDIDETIAAINVVGVSLTPGDEVDFAIPRIADDQLACISFTSGSTGQSKPNFKYWHTLHRSSAINYAFMVPDCPPTLYQLATMPAQHMWGLETSVLLALFSNICMSDAKPLFPQDIFDALDALPEPRMLASTPVHLRALCASGNAPQPLHSVLCATSPLTVELATEIEQAFAAPLREVYGCSEVGSMAVRRTAVETSWLKFSGLHFGQQGNTTTVTAGHLPQATVLQDVIEFQAPERFVLAGRASDLVKIAGKRGSLFHINQTLLRYKGLEDGIVFYPHAATQVTRLVGIVALKEGIKKADLLDFLKQHLDSAFIPRPLYIVDALPREANGKLLRKNIDALHTSLKKPRF